jgi:hypothetical protein
MRDNQQGWMIWSLMLGCLAAGCLPATEAGEEVPDEEAEIGEADVELALTASERAGRWLEIRDQGLFAYVDEFDRGEACGAGLVRDRIASSWTGPGSCDVTWRSNDVADCSVHVRISMDAWSPPPFPQPPGPFLKGVCEIETFRKSIPVLSKPTVYQHWNYEGSSKEIDAGQHRMSSFSMDNSISSLRVPVGWGVVLFDETNWGTFLRVYEAGDYTYVGNDINDRTSSLIVYRR